MIPEMSDWKATLASGSHPIWSLLGAIVAIVGIIVMAKHGSIHTEDLAGVGGSAVGGFVLRSFLGGRS